MRMRKSRNKMVFGVCGGAADALGADATLVRLAAVVAAFMTGGVAVAAYVAAALIVPEADSRG